MSYSVSTRADDDMRSIINISLPENKGRELRKASKKEGCASVSEFVRLLFREYQERKLAQELQQERAAFNRGEEKDLKSFKDLHDA